MAILHGARIAAFFSFHVLEHPILMAEEFSNDQVIDDESIPEDQESDESTTADSAPSDSDVIEIDQSGAGNVEAKTVNVNQGAIQLAQAETISIEQGGIGQATAETITVEQGGVGLAKAQDVTIKESMVVAIAANTVDASDVKAGLILARHVNGEVKTIISPKIAVVFGVATGLSFGMMFLLTIFGIRRALVILQRRRAFMRLAFSTVTKNLLSK